ncbi:hypothetical protein ACFO25_15490 [Paenactinomyces guangxiensis]|uniref:TetR transcriptional regulator CgmR-like C-terminal domain-containing protein n=1 Tax=Paenactinomyces guangxiensis TaxID=1490290 RepID=A0A7W1WT53_9BACL|nr:hypothetical protein [Paenactinomyces guangxiensis]MBA4495562.1 hypothetical protein [Paenactinomyces guangxiensis]MBH8592820.1 hypothetical protein [Paenactinomyces guangxiensis]
MIQHELSQFERILNRELEKESDAPGKFTHAFLRATIKDIEKCNVMNKGILTAIATNPEWLKPIQAYFAAWQERIEDDGLNPVVASIIRFAADGIWYAKLTNTAPPGPEQLQQIVEKLNQLSKGEGE